VAGPSAVSLISGNQLPEHALYPAPGCVLNGCLRVAEYLDSVVTGVRDVDVATGINRDTRGPVELRWRRATAAPPGDVHTVACELLDAEVVRVRDIDIPRGINRDTIGGLELARPIAIAAPPGDVDATACELLDTVVVGVRDVDVATGINRDTVGPVELPLPRALAAPLGAVVGGQLTPCCDREQSADDDERNHDTIPHSDVLVNVGTASDRV